MKGINPLKAFNIWMVNDKKVKYELVDTIDIEVDEDSYCSTLDKRMRFPLASLLFIKGIGEKVQDRILEDKMFKEYDAWVLSHIGITYKGKITVSIDVFKLEGSKGNVK